ncbi:MmcQ/YjbR family DNA-binding protein [Agromyces protaetiae]|uniref:MmcQ/YjbR family DNA-binding protein n=1 Tax=Agromyces protaetiae TaxID=2509455 RepID=A0A4P6FGI8_9MICO|nr:MmcQ/YjbR family DNA-binding protein [Agromyces protaetiae]QAY72957.1 MmcQ/YjbR family DNA-binding protein [Agromyces protaetiae]
MDWEGVRRLALSFPDTAEKVSFGSPHWRVHDKGFVWERPLRKVDLAHLGLDGQPGPVLGVRVEDEGTKLALIEEDPDVFFTVPHFDGWPAILVRLDRIADGRLVELVAEAWLTMAPVKVARAWLSEHATSGL